MVDIGMCFFRFCLFHFLTHKLSSVWCEFAIDVHCAIELLMGTSQTKIAFRSVGIFINFECGLEMNNAFIGENINILLVCLVRARRHPNTMYTFHKLITMQTYAFLLFCFLFVNFPSNIYADEDAQIVLK